jgi:hypothetical protein
MDHPERDPASEARSRSAHNLAPMQAPTLETIGARHGTDKSARHHGYLEFYERFFRDLRNEPICLLEIGVLEGASVRMWSEYFPRARVIGVDVNPDVVKFETERITIEIANQANVAQLVELAIRYGPFDIVLDDGSHMWNDQITSLQYLYPFVRAGGFYVIEDLDTSFGQYAKTFNGSSTVSAFQYLNKLAEYTVADVQLPIAAEPDPFIRTYAPVTEFIALHRRTALIRRGLDKNADRLAARSSLFPSHPLVSVPDPETPTSAVRAWLTVHIGGYGDRTSRLLAGGTLGDRIHRIQGFIVHLIERRPNELQYRALLDDNVWTEWVESGTFVGTRGVSRSIHGFAVRLDGKLAEEFDCTTIGSFVDHPQLVKADAGMKCESPTGGELGAMQIVLCPRR